MRGIAVAILVMGLAGCSSGNGEDTSTVAPAASSGSSVQPLDQRQVTEVLEDRGYTNIANLRHAGSDWTGSAVNEQGQGVNFDVDPYGAIHVK